MLGKHRLITDTHCEVYDLIKPYADGIFWDLTRHEVLDQSIYMIGRQQFDQNIELIRSLVQQKKILPVYSNPAEGSETIVKQLKRLRIIEEVEQGHILVLGGGGMEPKFKHMVYDSFLVKVLNYQENLDASKENIAQPNKPYKFLFLNGRARPHRKWLLERWTDTVLPHSLWTNLDTAQGPIKFLPEGYEIAQFQKNTNLTGQGFVKPALFENTWGDVIINSRCYKDTYCSIVSETVFDYPYSFRTEKIAKPIVIGHPWIAVANAGFYRDIHALGFKTFDPYIDESFDQIEDNAVRLDRIASIVEDMVLNCNFDKLLQDTKAVCEYNKQHLTHLRSQIRSEFESNLLEFLDKHDRFRI